MTEQEYKTNYYPKDVIKIGEEFFPLPLGFKLAIETKEIGSTLTTADGTKRKDIIATSEKVSFQYDSVTEEQILFLTELKDKINTSNYGTEKICFVKKRQGETKHNLYDNFRAIKIDIAETSKVTYKARTSSIYLASSFTLTLN